MLGSSGAAHGLCATGHYRLKEDLISNALREHDLTAFLEDAESNGTVEVAAVEELVAELDLGDDGLATVPAELEARGVEITAPATAKVDDLELDLEPEAAASVDSLTQFMNDIGKHALLTRSRRGRRWPRGSSAATRPRRSA